MNKLRTGIVGVGGFGAKVLAELGKNDIFQIIAIADQSIERAKDYALQYDAVAYDDYRLLIVQEKLDVLFLTLPTFLCGEYIHIAAKAGIQNPSRHGLAARARSLRADRAMRMVMPSSATSRTIACSAVTRVTASAACRMPAQ